MPSSNAPFSALAHTVKLTFSGQIPTLNGTGAGSTTVGSTAHMWAPNSSTNNQWTITGA